MFNRAIYLIVLTAIAIVVIPAFAQVKLPNAPLTTASCITHPPTIDGNGNDSCWQNTIAVKDFILFGTHTPASQATTVRLAYDSHNLYILVHCKEPLLKISMQSQSEIIAKAKKRDGKVLRDDSFVVFIQTKPHKQTVYEFTVNTLGTLLDAKMNRNNMWHTRDVSWNSQAKVAVKKYNGYWVEEMSIPLKNLGVSRITPGKTQWRIGLVREARSRHDLSSWQPTAHGAHSPKILGILRFAHGAISVTPDHGLRHLEPGRNKFSLNMGAKMSSGAKIITGLSSERGHVQHSIQSHGSESLTYNWNVKQQGKVKARWAVLAPRTHTPVYISPEVNLSVRSNKVTLTISAPGEYQVRNNGVTISHGKNAKNKILPVNLSKGVNVLTVRSQKGTAKLTLNAPWIKHFNNKWRTKPAREAKEKSWKVDDRYWPIAKPNARGIYGQNGKARIFRKTVLIDYTNVWPIPNPACYIAGNSTQPVTFTSYGLKGRKFNHWATYLAVPKGLKVMGSTGYYGLFVDYQPIFNVKRVGTVKIQGRTLPCYRVTASKPISSGHHWYMSAFQVYMQIANAQDAKKGVAWTLYYWSKANDGTVIEPPRSFEMRALPPLNGVQPKKFFFKIWGGPGHKMDNKKLRKLVMATEIAAGCNKIQAGASWSSEHGRKMGIGVIANISFRPWSLNLAPFLAKHPKAGLITIDGKRSKKYMRMDLLLGKYWHVVAQQLANQLKKRGHPGALLFDYEHSPLTGPNVGYGKHSLDDFRKYAGIAQNVKLTPKIIKKKYLNSWEHFVAWRVAKMFAKMKQTIHKISPGTKFGVYSGYQSSRTLKLYGIDWQYIGKMNAVDFVSCGYGRSVKRIRNTINAVRGIPAVFGVLLHPFQFTDLKPGTVATKAVILRRALDATGGVSFYARNSLDGRTWSNIAEVTRLVSKYEPLFYGRGINYLKAIPGQNPARVSITSKNGTSLVCVMNTSSKPKTFRFKLPVVLGSGKEFYSGKKVAAGQLVHFTLPAGGIAVYVLDNSNP